MGFREGANATRAAAIVTRDVDHCLEDRAESDEKRSTYRLYAVPRAIVVQDTEDGAFRLLQHLCLRAHGGSEVLLAATARIASDAVLLIILVYPDRGHCRLGSRRYPSQWAERIERQGRRAQPGLGLRDSTAAGTNTRFEEI